MSSSVERTLEPFGRSLREKYWNFDSKWVPVNHGSYGAAPLPVIESFRRYQDASNAAPDRFAKHEYAPELTRLRERLAAFVDADAEDVVMVSNTTLGVNVVLRGLTTEWEKGDRILCFSTSIYPGCQQTLNHVIDTHPHLSLSLLSIPLTYPLSHSSLIAQTRAAIEDAESDGTGRKIRLALVDAISSMPGVNVPWVQLVELFREKGILSLVDAAHEIGQQPVSLRTARPDFWVSNCHKWLLAHRACAVLYVSKPYQHLMHSLPISTYYTSRLPASCPSYSASAASAAFHAEFAWPGTSDWSAILSTHAALDFRKEVLGGEERIRQYCHKLAMEGGEEVARVLGTRTMRNKKLEEEGELVGCLVNVALPLPPPSTFSPTDRTAIIKYMTDELCQKHHTFALLYTHDDAFWFRLSAAVYVDLDDFRYFAKAVGEVCEGVKAGEWRVSVERGGEE